MTDIPWEELSERATAPLTPHVFTAAFDSDCAACGAIIFEGDEICYNTDDEVVHEGCYE